MQTRHVGHPEEKFTVDSFGKQKLNTAGRIPKLTRDALV